MESKAVMKTNLKQVHDSSQAPELDGIAERHDRSQMIHWFPSVVKLIGEQWFGEQRFSKVVYACDDPRGGLHYVETESVGTGGSPRVKVLC